MLVLAKNSGIIEQVRQTFIASIIADKTPENWQRCTVALELIDVTINLLEALADGNGSD